MNIEKLKEGMVIKNYKELCNLLGLKVLNGKSKVYQIQNMERYFSYHKNGNKFIIDEIYDTPKLKEDKRIIGDRSKYTQDFEIIMTGLLYNKMDEDSVVMSRGQLYKAMSLVNSRYSYGRQNINSISEELKMNDDYVYDFYNNSNSKLRSVLESNLRSCYNRGLLYWRPSISVCVKEPIVVYDVLGKIKSIDSAIMHREAEDIEIKLILGVEDKVLAMMGFYSKQEAFLKGKWREFKKKVEKDLKKDTSIQYYYDSYTIVFNNNVIKNRWEDINENIEESRIKLNSSIIKSLIESSVKRSEKINSNKDEYLDSQKTLINKFIKK